MSIEGDSMSLQDANWIIQKRDVRLRDIFSSTRTRWLAVLIDGYVNVSGRQVEVSSFDELESLQREFKLPPLSDIRAHGHLIEGGRNLPRWLVDLLAESSGGSIRIRTSDAEAAELDTESFASVMSGEMTSDELEATSTNNAWYVRMRNDDALIFIAASLEIAEKIVISSPANVRAVADDVIFAA